LLLRIRSTATAAEYGKSKTKYDTTTPEAAATTTPEATRRFVGSV
jgi:hypothetical protein